jgi:uncharacterized membrane protein
MTQPVVIQEEEQEIYLPSSKEVKLVVLCYLLIGLLVVLQRKELSVYEEYHVSQAIGRRVIFILLLVILIVLVLLPFVKRIPILIFLGMVALWWYMVYQAWSQKYGRKKMSPLALFHGIGQWFI